MNAGQDGGNAAGKSSKKTQGAEAWSLAINNINGIAQNLKKVSKDLHQEGSRFQALSVVPNFEPNLLNQHMQFQLYIAPPRAETVEQMNEKLGDPPQTEREMLKLIEPLLPQKMLNFTSATGGVVEEEKKISDLSLERLKGLSQVIDSKRNKEKPH